MNKKLGYLGIPLTAGAIALFSGNASADGLKGNQGRNLLEEKVQQEEPRINLDVRMPNFYDTDDVRKAKTKALWDAYVRSGVFASGSSARGFGDGRLVLRPENFSRLRIRATGEGGFTELNRAHKPDIRLSDLQGTLGVGWLWGDKAQLYTEAEVYGRLENRTGDVEILKGRGAGFGAFVGYFFEPTQTKFTLEGRHTVGGNFRGELLGAEHGKEVNGRYTHRELEGGIAQTLFTNEAKDFRLRALAQASIAKTIYDNKEDAERFYDLLSAKISGSLEGTFKFGDDHYLTLTATGRQRLFKTDFSTGHNITERTEVELGALYRPVDWLAFQAAVGYRDGQRGDHTHGAYGAASVRVDIKAPSKNK